MSIKVRREEQSALAAEWAALLERCSDPVPFLHPTWHRVWLEEFQDGREQLLYAARDDDGALFGVASLLRTDATLSFVGHYSICDYMDFVVAPDRANDFFPALLEALGAESWSEIDLRGLRDRSSTLEALPAAAQAAGLTFEREEEAVAPHIDLAATWEDYVAALGKKDRHELRRKMRRLQAAGELELHTYTTPPDVEAHLPLLLQMMIESRSDKANFMSEQMGRFFHRMAPALAAEGLIRLYELELDTKPVASVLCFDQGGQLYLYNSGYDPDFAERSVGIVSKAYCLSDAIESGKRCVDFLRGHEPYKYDLGGKDRQIYKATVQR
jgi:CelD/BcsL family acetyltransferase involved in cellulose biosynthesis